ncbi:MAG: hypothetical protein PHW69_02645 [Elusimicrobiaceae bacterium]|nr:hypothetical protein [Elusimicrobiaceae bacterium]
MLDKSPDWILWAYKNAARADKDRLDMLAAALCAPGLSTAPATPSALAQAGLGGLNE